MLSFSPEFIDSLAEVVADKVVKQLRNPPASSDHEAMQAKYGLVMDRHTVAQLLSVSPGTVKNMERRGEITRADVPGRSAKYYTSEIYQLVKPR